MRMFQLIFTIALMLLVRHGNAQTTDSVFVFEFAPKVYNTMIIGFYFCSNDCIKQKELFKVFFSKRKIRKVKCYIETPRENDFLFLDNGNVYYKKHDVEAFDSKAFKSNKILNDRFYNVISSNFVDLSNYQKLQLMRGLITERILN